MSKLIVRLLLCCVFILATSINGQSYHEKYRLQLHFSMPSGWANDPNGLIYSDEYYHLFYQHDPSGALNKLLHWGHARSRDLIHWENLPVALYPYEKGDIFSGCCVIDKDNVTGLISAENQDQSNNTIVAVYTLHKDIEQSQALAYSFDDGITWTQYDANPVLPNPGIPDFRDPNIFERDGRFYMALAVLDRISFYTSSNLLEWTRLGDFGLEPNEGDKSGVWECPSVVRLKDEQNNEHDILIVSENGDTRGSLTQYFVGTFNGTHFNSYDQSKILWVDNGFDNYAAIPYQNDPSGRVLIIGWMSNWLYAQYTPTTTWRGQMTIPRELALQTIDGNIHLVQRPIDELMNLVDATRKWSLSTPLTLSGNQIVDLTPQIPFKTGSMFTLEYVFNIENVVNGKVGLRFSNFFGEFITFFFDLSEGIYYLDRSNSGDVSFSPRFANRMADAKRIRSTNSLSGQVILDTASIEIFADDGLNTFSAIFFPSELFENIQLLCAIEDNEKPITVEKLSVAALHSIWAES
ncbi:uncharacterized protein LOC116345225 [Contarinia nasturtii]|uniref:uncharacterized protein LOC116345225 n=1 Tax=Contarinia nasturtii TaxID=265458 RepID=UPI0012D4938D|nr:uncharacterized protein LOC116345225 [Contarinia nasturtii]